MKLAHRNTAAWIAMFAMALQALWPLIAQAKPASPDLRVPVCTVDGITHYIDLAPATPPLEKRSAVQHQHCQLCLSGGDRMTLLPPPAVAALVIPIASNAVPAPRAVASPVSPPHPSAQPRAPPAFS